MLTEETSRRCGNATSGGIIWLAEWQGRGGEYLLEAESAGGHRFVGEELELAGILRQMIPEGQWHWGWADGQVSFLGIPSGGVCVICCIY